MAACSILEKLGLAGLVEVFPRQFVNMNQLVIRFRLDLLCGLLDDWLFKLADCIARAKESLVACKKSSIAPMSAPLVRIDA